MSSPQGIPNCPPGLEYLTTIDQLLVKVCFEKIIKLKRKVALFYMFKI